MKTSMFSLRILVWKSLYKVTLTSEHDLENMKSKRNAVCKISHIYTHSQLHSHMNPLNSVAHTDQTEQLAEGHKPILFQGLASSVLVGKADRMVGGYI